MSWDDAGSRPLTEPQLAMVYQAALDDGRPNCHAVVSMTCPGPLDDRRLATAVTEVTARHPALRSHLDLRPGRPARQRTEAEVTPELRTVDLRALPVEQHRRAVAESLRAISGQPFDLGRPPLVRFVAYRADHGFRLCVISHPAVLDRIGLRRVSTETLARYHRDGVTGGPAPAGEPFTQVPTGLVGEPIGGTARPDSVVPAGEVAAWAESFAGLAPSTPEFWATEPAATPPGADNGSCGSDSSDSADCLRLSRTIELSPDLVAGLARQARRCGTGVSEVVLAAHVEAVATATGRAEVVVGVQTRYQDSTGPGMSTNPVPVRLTRSRGAWPELVGRVATGLRAAWRFREVPVRRLQQTLRVDRLLDSTFDVGEAAADGVAGETWLPFASTLLAEFVPAGAAGSAALRLTAGPGLTRAQLRVLARLHAEALECCAEPTEPGRIPAALTEEQRDLVLRAWNGVTRPYRVDHCVHELVEEQVDRTPDATAVLDSTTSLTYRELDQHANRLAQHLRAEGIGVGSVVGVRAARNAAMLTSFLGIIKAGAAYLPLDSQQPAERIDHMLRDSAVTLVLTDRAHRAAVPAGPWTLLETEELAERLSGLPATRLGRIAEPEDLMYIMYTSGSTGTPKGVQVPHSGVSNYLGWAVEAYAGNGDGGAPVFSSTAFDMVVPNLYTPLLLGQRVCMIEETLSPSAVAERLAALAPFSFVKLTPGQLRLLAGALAPDVATGLAGTLVVGADAFPVRTLQGWRRIDDRTPLLNEYGPTEASVGNSVYTVRGDEEGELLPIGRPIPNTTMYVLDEAGVPVPVGVPGELYIGGNCVVRGYANRAALTAERFVDDPFAGRPGARMYRTGDIGRWLPDAELAFLGRVDDQVKIFGYRVEPAEVETVMTEHPSISEAVVTVIGDTRETLGLAGYYVGSPGLTPHEVRGFLRTRLPEYLVPGVFVPIPAIPLNANGKVDRKALPAAGGHGTASRRQAAARTPLGHAVAGLWREVFGVEVVAPTTPLTVVGVAEQVQLAVGLTRVVGIPASVAADAVATATTFGELCELLGRKTEASVAPGRPATAGPRR
ncbi:non-ribosomal peptide synthetase [Plantactinospora sp. WMMC1484]|uniref:non-ribosomal peptide synthetase n=1 Tax=Plantactinospora sp. WMMC1484 TaxID=3404122 RepID=UPI003BF61059